jgi:hypothetical protein
MELAALRKIIERWKDNTKVRGCVHDNDSKATQAIKEAGWQIEQMYDPNHVVKQFERRWNSCDTRSLRGLHAKLLMWFRYLIRCDFTVEEKQGYWMNSLEHFKGNHAKCPRQHPAGDHSHPIMTDSPAESQLREVLERTVELLARVRTGFDTQLNESCNSLKAKFANKDTSWKCSWPSRVMCALMQVNSVENWRIELADVCNIPLTPRVRQQLEAKWAKQKKLQADRGTAEYHSNERHRRWEARQADRLPAAGAADYHTAPPGECADAAGAPRASDQIIPYEVALRTDPSIEVPEEEGDASVRIVRNKSRPDFPSGCIAPPFLTERPPERTHQGDDAIVVDGVLEEPDDESDDDDDVPGPGELLRSLRPNFHISDDAFVAEGIRGKRLVMRSLDPEASAELDETNDPPGPPLDETGPPPPEPDQGTVGVTRPETLTGTKFIEESSGIELTYVILAGDNRWVMFDEERRHIRRVRPEGLRRSG